MHYTKLIAAILLSGLFIFTSCEDEDDADVIAEALTTDDSFSNLNAQADSIVYGQFGPVTYGGYTRFSFAKGDTVSDSNDDWDIAFRTTTILVNGGVSSNSTEPDRTGEGGIYIASANETINSIEGLTFKGDSASADYAIPTGSDNGWYNYNGATSVIIPLAGVKLVVKTHNGNYALVQIKSYYKDAPEDLSTTPSDEDTRFYTFDYTYTEGTEF